MAANAPTRMKKLINKVEDLVPESLAGLEAAHPDLVKIDTTNNVVLRAGGPTTGKVGLISGGGSGHEPLHGGFVGLGMLDAAAAGNVFTSPVPGPDGGRDPGRRRRRGRAPHRQELHGRRPELPDGGRAGRRRDRGRVGRDERRRGGPGLAVHGRPARRRRDRAPREDRGRAGRGRADRSPTSPRPRSRSTPRVARWASPSRAASCRRPARRPSSSATTRSRSGSGSTASRVDAARSSRRSTRWPNGSSRRSCRTSGSAAGDSVLAFVNGMGGTPLIELYGAFNSVDQILEGQGISIGRSLVGNYITSLEMAGFSVTLLRLDDELSRCGTLRSTRRRSAGASEPAR